MPEAPAGCDELDALAVRGANHRNSMHSRVCVVWATTWSNRFDASADSGSHGGSGPCVVRREGQWWIGMDGWDGRDADEEWMLHGV